MVSKNITILSLLLTIAMTIGTSVAIFFYEYYSLTMLILYAAGGLLLCIYVLVLRADRHRSVR